MKDSDIMFRYCKAVFYSGGGNYWYEKDVIGNYRSARYRALSFTLYFSYLALVVSEAMAAIIGNFPEEEAYIAMTFTCSQLIVLMKMLNMKTKKESVKQLIHDLVNACAACEEGSVVKRKNRDVKIVLGAYFAAIYGTTVMCVVQGLINVYLGMSFYTAITYYPPSGDDSPPAVCVRVVTTCVLFAMMLSMIVTVDGFVMVIMILFKYKFITLNNYFKRLNDRMAVAMIEDVNAASSKLREGLKEGVAMHNQLLRLGKDFDKCFGFVMVTQLFQSTGPVILLMLQISVSEDTDPVAIVKNILFTSTLLVMLGLYLCTAGDITLESSLLRNSIFNCGWHLCPASSPAHRSVRAMVFMACARSNRPLTMKAFNMVPLTHATYIQVIKSTYSVFTLVNARK